MSGFRPDSPVLGQNVRLSGRTAELSGFPAECCIVYVIKTEYQLKIAAQVVYYRAGTVVRRYTFLFA